MNSPRRSWAILLAWIAMVSAGLSAAEPRSLRALLVCGGCCHDYPIQKDVLKRGIESRARVVVDTVQQGGTSKESRILLYENPDWAKGYDVVIHDECFGAVADTNWITRILAPHRAGLPAVNLHCAVHSYRAAPGELWQEYLGLRSMKHGKATPIRIRTIAPRHPILRDLGWSEWTTGNEELYNNVKVFSTATLLQRGTQAEDDYAVTWVNRYGSTRVFSTSLGHFNETVGDERYLDLVTRGLLWACNRLDARHLRRSPGTRSGGRSDALPSPGTASDTRPAGFKPKE
jgi:type 1 glutamine amidotransferase